MRILYLCLFSMIPCLVRAQEMSYTLTPVLTKNRHSLDDVMRALYREYYQQKGRGFTEAEFRALAERIAGVSLEEFFVYVNTVKQPDYRKYFGYAGLDVAVEDGSFAISRRKAMNALQENILKDWLR